MSDFDPTADNSNIRSRRGREPFDSSSEQDGMMDYVKSCFNNYANFSGRARRSEYWYFQLFNFLVVIALMVPLLAFAAAEAAAPAIMIYVLMLLYALATLIPSLAVVARRLHDTGRSAWYYLISLIPFVGGIILLIFLVEDSKPGTNQWGPNPKSIENQDFEADAFL